MAEIGPQHPISYRWEIVQPLYESIQAGASTAVVGSSSMGKSRLIHFLLRPDVRQHYLSDHQNPFLFVWVDNHRLADHSEWAFYELIMTSLVEACVQDNLDAAVHDQLMPLRTSLMSSRDPLLARRNVELAIFKLIRQHGYRICFLLDEFDEIYRALDTLALTNLRAMRDQHKYELCYVLFLRDDPARLRNTLDAEGLYELFSRNLLGLKPYREDDAMRILTQLQTRHNIELEEKERNRFYQLSGGHPGMLVALTSIAKSMPLDDWPQEMDDLLSEFPTLADESRKLWHSLAEDEQICLMACAHGGDAGEDPAAAVLGLKGLIGSRGERTELFSPLFRAYVAKQTLPEGFQTLSLDENTGVVKIGSREVEPLTKMEFELLRYLYTRMNEVCTRDEILTHIYPKDEVRLEMNDNRIDNLVRHIRRKIELSTSRTKYLHTVWGRGYRLTTS